MAEELLSYHEVEELLESIISNKVLRRVDAKLDNRFVIFRHASTQEIIYSRYIRASALIEALKEGLPSEEQVEKLIGDRNFFTPADQKQIDELQEKIKAQKRLLQITKIEGRRAPIKEAISSLEEQARVIQSKGKELLYLSAEAKADEAAVLYLTYVATHTVDGNKYWQSFEHFEDETDIVFRNNLIEQFASFNRGLPIKTVRFLARHGLWRIRYSSALKLGGDLFQQGFSNLTPDQLSLLYWSDYYQMVYDMMPDDRPEDDVIDDDDALDAHVEALAKRRKEERNESRVKRRGGTSKKGKLSAWDRGEEIVVTAAHPEYMSMQYSEERIKASSETADVEVIAPNSRRARNRAQARRNRRK